MIRPALARKYTRALVAAAHRRQVLDLVVEQVRTLDRLAREDTGLRQLLTSTVYPEAVKRSVMLEILSRVYPGGIDPLTRNFFEALTLHHRLSDYLDIMAGLQDVVDEKEGILRARVTTATALSDQESNVLASAIESATSRRVQLDLRVDPLLLGGVVTRIGSTIYDGSVRNRLNKMKARLAHESA